MKSSLISSQSQFKTASLVLRAFALSFALLSAMPIMAQHEPPQTLEALLDETVPNALHTFKTPGLAIAVVSSRDLLFSRGYGTREWGNTAPVDENTYFRIASTTKAFTAATLAQLVEREQAKWDDKVIEHLPEFVMHDPYVTREMTLLDLLTHRSGLGGGAGDSMLWPEPSGFTRQEMIHNLRFLTPQSSFRSRYAYSNVMYITAAEVVSRVYQRPWESVVNETVFEPLNMQCYAGDVPKKALENTAKPYGFNDERGIYPIPRNAVTEKGLASAAAGGIVCNVSDMSKWLQYLLKQYQRMTNNNESTPIVSESVTDSLDKILSPQTLNNLWYPRTVLGIGKLEQELNGTILKAYGLGWRISNLYEHKLISHTGTLSGYQAYVAMLPDLDIGVVILNNGSNYGARSSVMQAALRHFLPNINPKDWVDVYAQYQEQRKQIASERYQAPIGTNQVNNPVSAYFGSYTDPWFGEMTIERVDDEIRLSSDKMPILKGAMQPFRDNTFVVLWDNQNAASDAFVHFEVDVSGQVSHFTLHPYDIEQQDNHEWRDMRFERNTAKCDALATQEFKDENTENRCR